MPTIASSSHDEPTGRLTDYLDLGVLCACYPRDLIEDVLAQTGAKEQRTRSLPAHVMVRHAIAHGLNPTEGSDAVMRRLAGSLRTLDSWDQAWKVPSTSAIAQARKRLGPEPLTELFHRACVPLAGIGTKGAYLHTWRLMAIDGTTMDVAETQANADHFGYSGNDRSRSAFPQMRMLTLSEVGTHAIVGASTGPYATGERTLAHPLAPLTEQGMLVLADAGFYSWDLLDSYTAGGADLLWRVGASVQLPPVRALPDGSYTALVFAPRTRRKTKAALITAARQGQEIDPERARLVRAVDYTVPEANPDGELITLITTVLDSRELSATQMAGAYAQRWEHETALSEVKRRLIGPGVVLSSQSPAMVTAQVYGILLAHYAIRELMFQAADGAGYDPDRMGFTHAVRVITRAAQGGAAFSP